MRPEPGPPDVPLESDVFLRGRQMRENAHES